uniref:Probably inactive leucine-rich repeat receptor-like protein kinase At5g48380 n=1 Tax=Nicotiana tabacum TaxID=4097 RepID=A0A1S3Y663_TOBAC|nr:PREDICTED: probably inactive leucine-rich repeat receptor-like protein kinase At5g48380 [Nicotiana tabacum]
MDKTNFKTSPFIFISISLGFQLTLLARFCVCNAAESDIYCLKSIKDSLQDPYNYLDSWDFTNATEGFICRFTGIQCWHPNENKVLNVALSSMDLQANCAYLNVLRLDNNNLEGEIPSRIGLLLCLKTFSVANNNLTGLVPSFVSEQITADSFANNPGLCGKPLNGCEDSEDSWIWKHIDCSSFITAFVVGWVFFSTSVLVLCLFQFPSKAINKIVSFNKWKLRSKEHSSPGSDSPSEEELSSQQKILRLEKFVTRMSFKELAITTSDFCEDYLVGNGMLGKVYKAILPNGWPLAIKKLNEWENLEDEFVCEITTLGGLRHRNLLPLIGFCAEKEKRLLVYKYMHSGNLHEWLHSTEYTAHILDFPLRLKIALGIAKGLIEILNQKYPTFGKRNSGVRMTTALSWSLFPAAEYSNLGCYKQDIYCFGVMLLELVTGKEPHELTSSRNLFDRSPCLLDADRDLLGKGINDLILQFLELACDCVKFFPNERPTMLEVYMTH